MHIFPKLRIVLRPRGGTGEHPLLAVDGVPREDEVGLRVAEDHAPRRMPGARDGIQASFTEMDHVRHRGIFRSRRVDQSEFARNAHERAQQALAVCRGDALENVVGRHPVRGQIGLPHHHLPEKAVAVAVVGVQVRVDHHDGERGQLLHHAGQRLGAVARVNEESFLLAFQQKLIDPREAVGEHIGVFRDGCYLGPHIPLPCALSRAVC